jgi:predicted nucleic acid-binding protein
VILVDTGVIYAVADRADADHHKCAELLATHPGPLLVPTTVIVEASWLIESRLGPAAEIAFLRSVLAGDLTRLDLTDADWARAADLVQTYADLGLGLVDASLVALAERLSIITLATLNSRDFHVVRPAHTAAFTLLP